MRHGAGRAKGLELYGEMGIRLRGAGDTKL